MNVPDISIWSIMPEVIVCLAGVVVMVDAFAKLTQRWLTGGSLGLAGALTVRLRYGFRSVKHQLQRDDRA